MKHASVLIGVGLVISGIAGFLYGRSHSHPARAATIQRSPVESDDHAPSPDRRDAAVAASGANALPAKAAPMSLAKRILAISREASDIRSAYEAEQLFATLTLAELPAAFQLLKALPPSGTRARMLNVFVKRWGALEGPGGMEAAKQLAARDRSGAEAKALEEWATTDDRAARVVAREMINTNPNAGFRAMGAMRELARTDRAMAMAETGSVTTDYGRRALRSSIIEAAAEDGTFESPVDDSLQLASPAEREAWVNDVFQRWGALDTDAPMNAFKNITDPELARHAMTGLLTGWVELDPMGAAQYALESHGDPLVPDALGPVIRSASRCASEAEMRSLMADVVQQGALGTIGQPIIGNVASRHPALAMELALANTDDRQRTMQTSMALMTWARNDFKAAASYIEAMPASPVKTAAVNSFANAALRQSEGPATLVRLLQGLPEQDCARTVQSIVMIQSNSPSRLSPEGAASLAAVVANTSGLPPEVLERAKKAFGPPSGP